jgi:hypothetical protein
LRYLANHAAPDKAKACKPIYPCGGFAARRRSGARRNPGQHGQPRCGDQGQQDLGRPLAAGTRRAHGIDSGKELEEHYRNRSMLGRDVLPEDIAEAVYFFDSDQLMKSTGNIINVDAGNAEAFTR